jgi:hypothetical protein
MDLHELAPVDRRATGGRDWRRRHEIGEPVEKLKRREVDDAIGYRRPDRGSAGRGDRGSPATCL